MIEDNLVVDCDGVKFKLIVPGTFQNESGENVAYDESIKFDNGQVAVKISAHGMAILYQALKDDLVLGELKERLSKEKKERAAVGF